MGANPKLFKKKLLVTSISSCLLASAGYAVAQEEMEEEVIVRGIRASIETSINAKRESNTIVDAISAEDIGKLPDVTIADSLQRISGVQIRRSAGEGSSVNIRGLPQVVTQLNGEQYLGAGSVVSTQPNFSDIPSQLFKGADVYKAATADLGNSGITGTINLRTYRPFDFTDGLTIAGNAEVQYGSETAEAGPLLSGLVNWKNDKVGVLASVTYSNATLSNSYNGLNTGSPGDAGWTRQGSDAGVDFDRDGNVQRDASGNPILDGNGDPIPDYEMANLGRTYLGEQGFAAWNQETERDRLGFNGSFQADLGDGFTLIADLFYTEQDEYNRKIGLSATNKWQGDEWIMPTAEFDTGTSFTGYTAAEISPKRIKSFTQNDVYFSRSKNVNLQLDYDNSGAFTGSFRAIMGDASREKRHGYNEGDLTNGLATLGRTTNFLPAEFCTNGEEIVGDLGGCYQEINPLGYGLNPGTKANPDYDAANPDSMSTFGLAPQLTLDTSGTHPTWGGFDRTIDGGLGTGANAQTMATYMSNLESYNVGAFSSENNEDSEGQLDVFSLKGSYAFEESFITSVDAGVRLANRSTQFERFNLFSPFHNAGCEAQWKATDVILNSTTSGECQDGEMVDGEFVGYVALHGVPLDQHNNVKWVTDFGPVNGIPGVWAVDPADYDDPKAFHDRVFGSTTRHTVPGSTFDVDMNDLSYYVQGNFESGAFSGNLGVRVIETELTVKQNRGGSNKAYGNTQYDVGDLVTKRSYSDFLPTLNVAYQATDDIVLRFAYTEAMTPLDLNLYGDGLTLDTALDSDSNSETFNQFIVSGGSSNGNPQLDPWRSSNVDVSAEWYMGETSMVSIAYFNVDIESFVEGDSEMQWQPDADGVVRRQINVDLNVQGEGGTLSGWELSAKLSLGDFIDDGFLANMGFDTNYTYSPSEGTGEDIYGDKNMFPDNSEQQFNLVGWYEADKFQARIAYNYRSERLVTQGVAAGALNLYQSPTSYVDISASYDITDEVSIYASGTNITGEFEDYYVEFEDQYGFQNYYEPRYTMGVRARF